MLDRFRQFDEFEDMFRDLESKLAEIGRALLNGWRKV